MSRVSDERVFRWWDYPLFALLTVLNGGAVVYAFSGWWAHSGWTRHPVLAVLVSLPLVGALAMYESRWLTLPLMRRPRPRPAAPGWKVGVATTFVPGAEPLEMLEETVEALVALDYPHDTWVLDEGDDEDVKALCRRLGACYFTRRHRPEYHGPSGPFATRTKHGNYNAWLADVAYEAYDVVVNFDPDHVPVPEFLDRLLGYFDDPEVGYVQAPQNYYNQGASFVARGAAEETYAYYSSIQMTGYALGYPIVTGCHTAHRATALREVGGFAAHDADDLLVTVHYRAAGWRGVYVPEVLAEGVVPVDWPGYLSQQRRWARSVLDVKLRLFPNVARRLPLVERVTSALHGLYYLHGLGSALAVALLCSMLVTGSSPFVVTTATVTKVAVLVGVFQVCEFYRQRFFLKVREEWGFHWRGGLLRFAKWPVVLLAAVDVAGAGPVPYAITPKVKAEHRPRILLRLHALPAALVALAWVIGTARGVLDAGLLHAATAAYLVLALGILATELVDPPPGYDPALAARRSTAPRRREPARASSNYS